MKEQVKQFSKNLGNIFIAFSPLVEDFSKTQSGDQNLFEKVTKAVFVKAYEFNRTITGSKSEDVYFMMSALRGICEEYIAIKFISAKLGEKKDQVVDLKFHEDLYNSAVIQWKFFKKNHPTQILFHQDDFETKRADYREELRGLMAENKVRLSGNINSLPSVHYMADKSELLELYNYLYDATSSLVHFNPRILLRMGWGKLPEITFSVKNFNDYYKHFATIYGAYLFINLCRWMISVDLIDKVIESELQKVDNMLKAQDRWPELVTFEEMNIGSLSKHLFFKSPDRKG